MDTLLMKKFAKNPTDKNATFLDESTQMIFYAWSTYVVKNKVGNIVKARKIREVLLSKIKKSICIDHRGLKSILLGCRLITQLNFGKNISMDIYIKRKKAFQVYYNADPKLPNMFSVNQQYGIFGVDKELTLYYEGVRDYFKDTFMDFPDIRIDKIDMVIRGNTKPFYEKELGVIWNEEKCAECTKQALKGDIPIKCKKHIDKKCYTTFRNAPEFIFKDTHEEQPFAKITQVGTWECSTCMLMNPPNVKKCRACKHPK